MGLLKKVTGTLFGDPTAGFDKGINAQTQMYNQGRSDLKPYMDFGGNYLAEMRDFMSKGRPTAETIKSTPGYQFRMDQGREAIENSAIARGGLLSGNTMKAITDYGQDYASNEYDKELLRDENQFARLMQLLSMGQNSAAGSANMAMSNGNTLAQLLSQQGQAEAEMMQFPWKLGAMAYGASQTGGAKG
jgi:hypothetical protein